MRTPRRLALLVGSLALAALVLPPASAGAWSPRTSVDDARDDDPWALPADGPVAGLFAAPAVRWGPGHRGVDLLTGVGAPVASPRGGVVSFVGSVAGRGVVTVQHQDGLRSSLEPVTATVALGDRVETGTPLGHVSDEAAHCSGCLHWGVRRGSDYLDPLGLLPGHPVVLLAGALRPGPPPGGRCAAGASPRCASARSVTR
ncbi:murein hydrolase activator EnvC [Actinotalea sp.]|uniref:murein hydrolase activator EnvC family protein n=1 Tax=Actinotalea sp. TaxID=1872145 RepID=UPI0035637825